MRYYNAPSTKQVKQRDGTYAPRPNSLNERTVMKEMLMVFVISFAYEWLLTSRGINAPLPNMPGESRQLSATTTGETDKDEPTGLNGSVNPPDAGNHSVNQGEGG